MIPKLIHFVWVGRSMPSWAKRNISRFGELNPGYQVEVHDESSVMPEMRVLCSQLKIPCQKSDLIRYSVLTQKGGWYFDTDFFPLRSLDDAVKGFAIDGTKLFCSKQNGHKAGERLPYANAPLACAPGDAGIETIIETAIRERDTTRTGMGPKLLKKVIERHPRLFHIAESGWFFPIAIPFAAQAASMLYADPDSLDMRGEATAGQVPYAAHLWAGAIDLDQAENAKYDPRPVAAVLDYTNPIHWTHSLAKGLEKVGYCVVRPKDADEIDLFLRRPVIVAGWNGIRDKRWWNKAKAIGAVHLACEHGFWKRQEYMQCDHAGFLHRSSWSKSLKNKNPAPEEGRSRLEAVAPKRTTVRARSDGYILILGQVDNDTQLVDSEIPGHAPLLRHLGRSIPRGTKAIFRPHPMMARRITTTRRWPAIDIQKVDGLQEMQGYRERKGSIQSLAEAFSGARFCVSINSNALLDATVAGIPCMAFGPALGIDAGVYLPAKIQTAAACIKKMLDGWAPDDADVQRYLEWMASRQWNRAEMEEGTVVRGILERAGVEIPEPESDSATVTTRIMYREEAPVG